MTEAERAALETLRSEVEALRRYYDSLRRDQQRLETVADMFYRAGREDAHRSGAPPPALRRRRGRLWIVKAATMPLLVFTAAGPCPYTSGVPVVIAHPPAAVAHYRCKPRVRREDGDCWHVDRADVI